MYLNSFLSILFKVDLNRSLNIQQLWRMHPFQLNKEQFWEFPIRLLDFRLALKMLKT